MDILGLVRSLRELGEQERLEVKTARQLGDSLLETVCAFANEPRLGGGCILLGIEEEENALFPSYDIVGVSNPDKVVNDLVTQCRTVFNVPVRIDIEQGIIGGKQVIGVQVPEAQPGDKPVFFKRKGLPAGAFRRIGASDQRCTEDDMIALYQGRMIETYDYTVVPDAGPDDLDPSAIEEYRAARAEANPDAEELKWSDVDLLRALGCVRNGSDGLKPTVAGILLFGSSQAIRRLFPMMRVDYIRVPGREWISDPESRFSSIDMRGSLFSLIRRTQAAILDDLPKGFSLPDTSPQREDRPVIPVRVIREAVVNALMHRNYRVHSPIQIIRYANRLEIRNPGYSLKAIEHLGEPGSESRNPKIASVLHETRFAETKGSGVRVMRAMMEEAGLTPPLFESDRGQDLFVATYLFHHFLSSEDLDWLGRFRDLELTDEEARALVFLREAGAVNNLAYRTMNKVDPLNASHHLRRLRDLGLIEARGKGSATYYVPTPLLMGENQEEIRSPLSPGFEPLSPGFEPLSPGFEPLSPGFEPLSPGLPPELKEAVERLGQRKNPDDMRAIILGLCAWRSLRAGELAEVLGRDQRYLTKSYLAPMIRNGELEYTIPENPAHPKQAYRAADREE